MHAPGAVPRLQTTRLLLREWRPDDRDPFAALNADPEVAAFLAGPLSRAASDALLDRWTGAWDSGRPGVWAIERRADGVLVGAAGLSIPPWAPEPTTYEIGWRLAHHAWGNGYATEAAREAMRFAFEVLELDGLVSYTSVNNVRSRRVMERLGMYRDGPGPYDFLHPGLAEGHPLREHVTYRLSREAWLATRPSNVTSPGTIAAHTAPMDKTTLVRDMRETHAQVRAAAASLDDDALLAEAPGMPGWTRKEVLAHLEWWSDHSARVVTALLAGEEPYDRGEPFDLDAHNERIRDEARHRPAGDVRRGESDAFERVLAAVEAVPEDDLLEAGRFSWLDDEPLVETIAWDTVRHYPEHLPHLTG